MNRRPLYLLAVVMAIFSVAAACTNAPPADADIWRAAVVVEFWVVTQPGASSRFLEQYCRATHVPLRRQADGLLRAGSFLSRYEASWLANVVPGASVDRSSPINVPLDAAAQVYREIGLPAKDASPSDTRGKDGGRCRIVHIVSATDRCLAPLTITWLKSPSVSIQGSLGMRGGYIERDSELILL